LLPCKIKIIHLNNPGHNNIPSVNQKQYFSGIIDKRITWGSDVETIKPRPSEHLSQSIPHSKCKCLSDNNKLNFHEALIRSVMTNALASNLHTDFNLLYVRG
jgi:hypothetical protein